MQFIRFNNDYSEGAHFEIMARLNETNMVQTAGYGEDPFCDSAKQAIKDAFGLEKSDIHFLVGGTQANLTVIAASLRPHQGVLCADTGHINVHETGAIEACGHKVIGLPHEDGKISADQVEHYVRLHFDDATHEHMVQPKLVYISYPTEFGTLYSDAELRALKAICETHGLILFIDGARLGYGLTSTACDIDMSRFAEYSDVFTIGGTKVGALFGEAVVIQHDALKIDFRYLIKQKGGMLAKGRLLGIQFLTLFSNDLYLNLGKHANLMADQMRKALTDKGLKPFINSPTNQLFFIVPDMLLEKLSTYFASSYIERFDSHNSVVRFCTSWATRQEDVDTFVRYIETL